jgi:hypothetical protein
MFDDLVVASLTARALPPSHDVALCTTHCLGGLAPVASPSDDEAGIGVTGSACVFAFVHKSTGPNRSMSACGSRLYGKSTCSWAELHSAALPSRCRVALVSTQHIHHSARRPRLLLEDEPLEPPPLPPPEPKPGGVLGQAPRASGGTAAGSGDEGRR